MNSLFDSADLMPQPRYSEPVKFKHFSGVAKAVLSAREVLETPNEQPRENEGEGKYVEPYKEEWDKFAQKYPNATIKQILDFKDELKERAARERNFKAMDAYGMPQWFWLANEAEVLERQARENSRRANSEFWQNYGRKGRK
jgi:hypothetical protein